MGHVVNKGGVVLKGKSFYFFPVRRKKFKIFLGGHNPEKNFFKTPGVFSGLIFLKKKKRIKAFVKGGGGAFFFNGRLEKRQFWGQGGNPQTQVFCMPFGKKKKKKTFRKREILGKV